MAVKGRRSKTAATSTPRGVGYNHMHHFISLQARKPAPSPLRNPSPRLPPSHLPHQENLPRGNLPTPPEPDISVLYLLHPRPLAQLRHPCRPGHKPRHLPQYRLRPPPGQFLARGAHPLENNARCIRQSTPGRAPGKAGLVPEGQLLHGAEGPAGGVRGENLA